ncbi:MAG: ornithine--oxo-acid transaminase [Calditrichia bacterium]
MDSKTLIQMEEQYGAHNYHPLDVVISRAEGIWVYDVEGKKYLDFLSAYSAVNQGHCHPKIVKAMSEQMSKVALTSRAFRNDQLALFYKKLVDLTGLPKVLPMNSGAEAVETALKAARKWGYKVKGVEADKAEIIVCENNFHGRTISIISFSTEEQYKDGFGPLTPGFKVIPYGDSDALKAAITKNTVAFLVEPIQGEGGIIIPRDGFLKEAQQICRENKVLFILDEIQTGLARTGKMFAHYWEEGVRPDGLILGKALSGGMYPISAFVSTEEVMDVFNPGDHGSTFGGNPLAAAIGQAALDVLVEENLADHANELGNYFMDKLRSINSDHIKEVRGRGLLIGVELKPEAGGARRFCEALQEEGLLAKETHDHVIRFAPPLVITKEDIDWAFERINKVLTTL